MPKAASDITIEVFESGNNKHKQKFAELNREWLVEYGILEPADEATLANPEKILNKKGIILLASVNGEIVGTGALLKGDEASYEIAKMAVTASARGLGIGRRIAESLITRARAKGARRLYLESNRKLDRALMLYRSLGFTELSQVENPRYASCDIAFEMALPHGNEDNKNLSPTRYGDWEIKGKCVDF